VLKSLTIEGFRGFATKRVFHPGIPNGTQGSGLTIIVGPNNSGKSSLLEPFKYRGRYEPTFNVGLRNQTTDFVKFIYEFSTHAEILESADKGTSKTKASSNFNNRDTIVYYVPSRRHINHFFGRGGPTDRRAFMQSYLGSSADRGPVVENFETRISHLYAERDRFNPFIRRIFPDFMDWSIDEDQNGTAYIKMWTGMKTHASAGIGEGVVSAIVLSAALYDSQPGETIVIDEPELSLHPQVQRRLMNVLVELSSDRQIIIATHSPYFLTREAILGGATIVRTWDRDGSIEIFSISSTNSS
jgi:AAA15 family ATPase/GTPase